MKIKGMKYKEIDDGVYVAVREEPIVITLTEGKKMIDLVNQIRESLKQSGKSLYKEISCKWDATEKAYEVDIIAQGLEGSKQAARVLILPLTGQMQISFMGKKSANRDHAMTTYMMRGNLKKWHRQNAQKIYDSFASILEVSSKWKQIII